MQMAQAMIPVEFQMQKAILQQVRSKEKVLCKSAHGWKIMPVTLLLK